MDYNFWDDRTHEVENEVEINPCEGCYDYQNRKCISNGGCGFSDKHKRTSNES